MIVRVIKCSPFITCHVAILCTKNSPFIGFHVSLNDWRVMYKAPNLLLNELEELFPMQRKRRPNYMSCLERIILLF